MSKKTKKRVSRTIAVVADGQNVSVMKHSEVILRFVQQFGEVPILWAYHDWKKVKESKQKRFQALGWQCLSVITRAKNDLDKCLIDDCQRLFQHWLPDIVVLISGDRDFVPLVKEVLGQGKQVIVIGRQNHVSHRLQVLVPKNVYFVEDL
jgi:uncharacterized protein (TIGR00288 family)